MKCATMTDNGNWSRSQRSAISLLNHA